MTAFLQHPLVTHALCWRIERRDGVALGFTGHDRDLVIDGLVYRAAPGMLPSAVARGDGFDAGGLDMAGALTSDALSEADLDAGRWDGAKVALVLTDWREPGAERLTVARGTIGEVALTASGFEAELKGPAAALEAAVVEQTSAECRATLGDRRCRVDLAPRERIVRLVLADGETLIVDAGEPSPNAYAYGRLRWLTGANSGLAGMIRASDGAALTLRAPPFRAPAPGDLIALTEGCDRSLATCAGRFGNAVNFRGEPHLPGMDLLTRYPGA